MVDYGEFDSFVFARRLSSWDILVTNFDVTYPSLNKHNVTNLDIKFMDMPFVLYYPLGKNITRTSVQKTIDNTLVEIEPDLVQCMFQEGSLGDMVSRSY